MRDRGVNSQRSRARQGSRPCRPRVEAMEARWLPAPLLSGPALAAVRPAALAATTTTVTSSANPVAVDQPVTLTATVAGPPGAGTPTGTVTFMDGTTLLGTAPLAAGPQAGSGVASLTLAALLSFPDNRYGLPHWPGGGPQPITAAYSGDAGFQAGTSAFFTQVVAKVPDTFEVASTPYLIVGQPVRLVAGVGTFVVADSFRSPITSIGGTITFYDGATPLGTVPIVDGPQGRLVYVGGSASLTVPPLALGPHTFRATYSGDAFFYQNANSAPTQDLEPAPTTTSLAVVPGVPAGGQAVALSAIVVGPNYGSTGESGPVPGGTITFYDFGAPLGTVPVTPVPAPGSSQDGASAGFTIPKLGPGAHAFRAVYSGNANDSTSGSTGSVPTSTPLASSVNPADPNPPGAPVTVTATVAAPAGGQAPGGTVAFYDGLTLLGAASLTPGAGSTSTAAISLPPLFPSTAAGPHLEGAGPQEITAVYTGLNQPDQASVSPTLVETFVKVRAAARLGLIVQPTAAGATVSVTATFGPAFNTAGETGPAPVGSVVFYRDGRRLGTVPLVAAHQPGPAGVVSVAELTLPGIPRGLRNFTAFFEGDATYAAAGTATDLVVNAQTRTTIAATPAAPVVGRPIVVTATVIATGGGGIPAGDVAFAVGGHPVGVARLDARGRAVFAFQPAASVPIVITAHYLGAVHAFYDSASTPLRVTVGVPATAITDPRGPSR